mmetsp:Transcript_44208/g.84935  ORF Transcript_44208/g.84935 Transcript_44208/m.84935 type:complete len:100 (+) Transcript_44208:1953-2252(+)
MSGTAGTGALFGGSAATRTRSTPSVGMAMACWHQPLTTTASLFGQQAQPQLLTDGWHKVSQGLAQQQKQQRQQQQQQQQSLLQLLNQHEVPPKWLQMRE